jgi:cation diffusion facilitator family transporter
MTQPSSKAHSSTGHKHHHGVVDPKITDTEQGIRAVKWSFWFLMATAVLQVAVVVISGSVALLADTLHNFGDAFTSLPLWIAFHLARRPPTRTFTYGLGRMEDLAGVLIVALIFASAVAAGYESLMRFLNPRPVKMLWVVAVAALIGFAGNELVARFRLRIGKEINSAALEADGHHARIDALVSLGVLVSAFGLWIGYPVVDPIVGLMITLTILKIVWDAGKRILLRLMDGIDSGVADEIRQAADRAESVLGVSEVRARWIGHRLHAEVNLAVAPTLSVRDAHDISKKARHHILHELPHLSNVLIHVDPPDASGEIHHEAKENDAQCGVSR